MNNEEKNEKRNIPHHGPGRVIEKPKDFKLAIKKLMCYLKPFVVPIVIALILSMLSSVLSILGPNKLSDLTDEISKGLGINTKNMELITNDIQNDFKNNMILSEFDLETLNDNDKTKYYEVLSTLKNKNEKEIYNSILSLPDSVKLLILKDTKIKNVSITSSDKLSLLKITSNNSDEVSMYKSLDSLPKNIKSLIKPKIDLKKVNKIGIFLVCIFVISAIFSYIENYIMVDVSNNFAYDLRKKISKKINKLPLKYFDKNSYGDILSRVTNDVDTINMSLQNSLGTFMSSITLFIGSLIMMFSTNVYMAITGILSSLIGFAVMSIIMKNSQKYFVRRQTELGKLNGHIEEAYSSHLVIKAYNATEESTKKFNEYNSSLYDCNRKSQFLSGLMPPLMGFVGNFSYVCVCIVGAVLVIKGNISFGVIVAFMIYVRLFTNPLTQIAQSMTQLQSATSASERVFEFIEEMEMNDETSLTKSLDENKVKGEIEFKNVSFGYDESKIIINNFNFKAKPGEKIAIVGPTGAGKTTIVNLLMKFYEINKGDIIIDGVSTKELTRENIHDLFIMILQDTWLFEGTIKDNIKYNKKNVTDEDVWNALKIVGVDHFVKSLPKTLDYKIEDNDSISSGQKQLLTIARGMIKNSPFLILDEATSSVDTRTEELVQKAMDKLTKGRTSFIIAHRLSTIKNADHILVMKDGNIIEQGNHDELIKKNGFYAELYNSQFKN